MGIIFGLSSVPSDNTLPSFFPFFDKIAHLIEYTGLGWLLNNAFNGLKLAAILIGSLYGLSDEFHQLFTPGRECDYKDLLCDIAGCTLGQFIGLLAWWKAREKNNPLTPFIKGE
ncbi:MAG: VanZ family protein [Candidatus Desantisbacteria bacterium]